MEIIINCLKTEGPRYGYHINPSKGKYLIGRCDSIEIAEQVRERLVHNLGLSNNIIINHPDNNPSDISMEEKKQGYGVKVVGSFIGTPEYIRHQLDFYFQELEKSANKLICHKDLQERMILFRDSFLKKPLHIFRTVNPKFTQEFARKFEVLKIKVLCSILGFDSSEALSDLHCKIAQLSIKEGGLGLQDHWLVGQAAFVASIIDYHQKFKVLTPDMDITNISEDSFLGQFLSLSQLFCGEDYCSLIIVLLFHMILK